MKKGTFLLVGTGALVVGANAAQADPIPAGATLETSLIEQGVTLTTGTVVTGTLAGNPSSATLTLGTLGGFGTIDSPDPNRLRIVFNFGTIETPIPTTDYLDFHSSQFEFTGFSVDPSSSVPVGALPPNVGIVNGEGTLELGGLVGPSETILLDVETQSVPEPNPVALVGLGGVGLSWMQRRRTAKSEK